MIQRLVRHFPADGLALVQGSAARQVVQLEECCCSGHSPDRQLGARINAIQTNVTESKFTITKS